MPKSFSPFQPDTEYRTFLQEVKSQVKSARVEAARNVNRHLISLYWNIGKGIAERQKHLKWGKSVVEQLAKDLQKEFTGQEGFSAQNLWYMRQLYQEYSAYPILQQLVGEIPWSHNLLIMSKVKDIEARAYYLKSVADYGWTRNILAQQIQGQAYQRRLQDPKAHNFQETLTPALAEQADKAMKSVYALPLCQHSCRVS
jgi:predicted nuclease of restriction endonuclease-like (RecB) superfamily